jgi:glutamate formiminotransferase
MNPSTQHPAPSTRLVECVPNFSEGRDAAKVDAIVEAIRSVRGIAILDREMDADHNRCVITFAGPATSVVEAAFRGVERAIGLIDLRQHNRRASTHRSVRRGAVRSSGRRHAGRMRASGH